MSIKQNKTTKFTGRYFSQLTAGSGIASIALNPLTLDSRLVAVSDAFQEYRFLDIRVRLCPFSNSNTIPYVPPMYFLAHTPVVPTNVPSTWVDLANFSVVDFGSGLYGSKLPSLRVGRKKLFENAPKWFRRGTAYDDLLEVQGYVYVASPTSVFSVLNVIVEITYVVELGAPAETGTTRIAHLPADVVARLAKVRETAPPPSSDSEDEKEFAQIDIGPLIKRDQMVFTDAPRRVKGLSRKPP